MRSLILAVAMIASPTLAQSQSTASPTGATDNSASPAATTPSSPAAATKFSTDATVIGTLLDDAATKAILVKYLPEVVNSEQIDMARNMTLTQIQPYSPDIITDAKLAEIDAAFAKLSN